MFCVPVTSAGVVLSLPEAGVSLTIPEGALAPDNTSQCIYLPCVPMTSPGVVLSLPEAGVSLTIPEGALAPDNTSQCIYLPCVPMTSPGVVLSLPEAGSLTIPEGALVPGQHVTVYIPTLCSSDGQQVWCCLSLRPGSVWPAPVHHSAAAFTVTSPGLPNPLPHSNSGIWLNFAGA